jgi:hypothetical protein
LTRGRIPGPTTEVHVRLREGGTSLRGLDGESPEILSG